MIVILKYFTFTATKFKRKLYIWKIFKIDLNVNIKTVKRRESEPGRYVFSREIRLSCAMFAFFIDRIILLKQKTMHGHNIHQIAAFK